MTWANQVRILKQNFEALGAVIGRTFINMLKPVVSALNVVIGKLTEFATAVSNALGKIFGWKFEESGTGGVTSSLDDAEDSSGGLADNLGTAADNAKKLKSHLLAIDELNVYEPTEDSSSSGGSGSGLGSGGASGGSNGEWVRTDGILKDYESDIDSLYELGEYIGKVLTDMMNNIDWEAVYEKARNFGKGLADFLNGLISPELFGAVGRTIAGALNAAIYAALAYGERFDWKDFGLSLATGLNEFFLTFDFESLAAAINVWVKGILDTIIVFLEKTDWNMIGEKIGTFLAEIDFLDIGMKVGRAIWDAINAGFELLGGMFNKAPFETIILSVVAFKAVWDKLIKVKVVPWINKITKALKGFGNTILALTGSRTALTALIDDFPKLGAAVGVARQAFANFQFGIANGNLFTGLNEGINTVRSSLTGLQKGAITAVAGFAEFSIVSDSFKSITEGSENLIAEITKISATVAAAGAAMTLVLGFPAGVVAAGIIGLIGAIKGINDGIEELQLNSMFETIRTAGTVSLEALGNVAKSAFESITVGLDTTIEKLNSVSQTRESIDGTVESIDGIRLAVENGAYSTAEKIPEIISQFQSLLDQSKQLFNEEYDVIVGNIVGAQADILEAQGQSIPLMIANLAKLRDEGNSAYSELESSMASLVEQYNNGTISETAFLEQFTPLYEQLKGVNSDGSINAAADSIRDMGSALDMSQYIYDNTFQVSEFQAEVDSVVQAAKDGKEGLAEAAEGYNTTLEDMKNQLEAFGIDASGFDWSAAYGASEEQVSQGISNIESAYSEYANQIQYHLLEQLPSVVEDATKDYENLSWWEKLFTTKSDYVQGAVDQWKDNILTPATSTLQSGFEQLGIDGETWASTAATKMTDSLFGEIKDSMDMGVETTTTYLKSDWETILDDALSGAAEAVDAESYGKDTVEGYNKGVKDNAATTNEAINKWMNDIPTTMHNSDLKFGSPSKTAEEYGKWTIDGFNLGIANNQDSTRTAIEGWMGTISAAMEEKWNEIKEWWNNTALVSFFDESIIPNFGYDKWYEILGEGMFLAFQDKWNEFYAWWSEEVMPLWNEEQVEPNFGHDKWYEFLGNGMFLAFSEHIKLFLENWKQNISKWWKEDVEPWFKKEKWLELLQKVKEAFSESFTAVKENTKSIMEEILEIVKSVVDEAVAKIGEIKTAAEEALGAIESLASKISGLSGGGISLNVSGFSMPKFATGGVVTRPTIGLFGESGAEAIVPLEKNAGWISSVAEQLESYGSKDSDELLREQNELLRQQNELLSYLADKEIVATLDTSRETINGFRTAERRLGYSFT